ncbi:MAG: tRNA (adenosine(37)-N6)-threonylcarbamoyltransferase complex ATPase subunit type 1 TsaE [Bacteroidia bacterium]|jgi:tRNA threonylcarbamoyladenosine biosynthesis protein TsaE|nr:tRNA (adenosine(37)-N6)-threonylcarbamoyltransferase complex ATPase subunit type 1 TsaE [Bacteroidia bacterium]
MNPTVYRSEHPGDLPALADKLLTTCNHARIFALYGDLGAGKTTLVKALCARLGVRVPVTSPTFTLVHEYPGADGVIFHFDCYRLSDEAEAWELGFDEYLNSGQYCFVEWPARIAGLLPSGTLHVYLTVEGEFSRTIEISEEPHG